MKRFLRHLFTPHHTNNHRAKLLHNSSLFIAVCLILVSSFTVGIVKTHTHAVLGISANISSQELLHLTNQARQANGLPPLTLDAQLAQAAAGKAEDMFTNNYWAHISPTGITPWDFIHGAGYNYQYAGENLARGYSTATDAMTAWMASPGHRANILSPNYSDVGFAVAQGNLTGDTDTVLIVEEFGRRLGAASVQNTIPVVQQAAAQGKEVQPTAVPTIVTPTPNAQILTHVSSQPLIDSQKATKTIGIALLVILIVLLALDLLLIGRRKLVRIVGHNLDHILFFATIIIIALLLGQGIVF